MGERRLLGEVAIVTGAAHGIGRAIAVELAREGASVWACDVLERELGETRRAVGERAEGPCRAAVVDVTDRAAGRRVRRRGGRGGGPRRRPGELRRRRRRPDHEAGGGGLRRGLARDLRGEPRRRVPLHAGRGARHEGAPARQHREHLVGRGPLLQPDRHPGLRERQGGADRVHAPDGARARRVRDPRQLRGAGLRPLEPGVRAPVAGDGRGRPAAAPRLDRAPAARRAGGHRPRRALLRLRRRPLRHRPDDQRRRRPLDAG